jgi:DNA-binding PadR family transcriptional regulator
MAKNELISLALIWSEPRHAYALNTMGKALHLERWARISQASLYNALARLAEQGCVQVTIERPGNMPERKVYSITEQGRERLRAELREALLTPALTENPFYLAISFAFGLPAAEIVSVLKERIKQLDEALGTMKKDRIPLMLVRASQPLIMLDAGIKHIQVEIECARKHMRLLGSKPDYYEKEVKRVLSMALLRRGKAEQREGL